MEDVEQKNYGLSKKTNVAMAAITGITIVANTNLWQSIIATLAICAIAFYQLTIQGKIDLRKEPNDEA